MTAAQPTPNALQPARRRVASRPHLRAILASAFVFALALSASQPQAFAAVANPSGVAADEGAPQAAAEGFGALDPAHPVGITVEQIIEKMGKREAQFAAARQQYVFRQSVKVDTISEDTNRPDGEYQQIADVTFDQNGRRAEHVVFAPQNTLERVIMTPTDFDEIVNRQPFILTTEQLPQYDLTYLGRQKVDDLDTYVFDVKPKQIVKGHHYFQGKVWVDMQDVEIVVVTGTTVPQDTRRGHEDLQPPFTTYYQQIDGKYWFPTYTKAEGTLHFAAADGNLSSDIHMLNVVKYTDYKLFHATVTIHYDGQDISQKPDAPDSPPPAKPEP